MVQAVSPSHVAKEPNGIFSSYYQPGGRIFRPDPYCADCLTRSLESRYATIGARILNRLDTQALPFSPHPNLDDVVNRNIVQSEIEGGVYLDRLPAEITLEIETQNRLYTLVHRGHGEALLSGHPEFCPQPVLVRIEGCNWGGSMLKVAFLGRGMCLEFRHPHYSQPIVTSRILDIRPSRQAAK